MARRTHRRRWPWVSLLVLALLLPFIMAVAYIWLPVPGTPLMAWRFVHGYGWQRTWVPLNKLPPVIPKAIIASEDNRFCLHGGVDWLAVQDAYAEWQAGSGLRGASTVSMQVARNVFLWPNQDPIRKALEVPFTYLIEKLWGKRRIMEVYLNIAEWGPGVYGIEAAAKYHFGKRAKNLTRTEVYRLVSILPSPLKWNPKKPSRWAQARVNSLGLRVVQLGPTTACVTK